MLKEVCKSTDDFIRKMPKEMRKKYGQFFTSEETARFMSSLFSIPKGKKDIKILDAGAGSGILAVALIERLMMEADTDVTFHVICYENDTNILPLLTNNLKQVQNHGNGRIKIELNSDNYLLSQYEMFNNALFCESEKKSFDMIIGNPPYKKIPKDAPEARALQRVCYGAPNLYFLFASMGIFNLSYEGEMVYIIPRSWTSGAYFERFRNFLERETRIENIHLFISRDKVFDKESVLQETMIIKLKKTQKTHESITITSSENSSNFNELTVIEVPYDTVVSKTNGYIYLITDEDEMKSLEIINQLDATLPQLGMKMKTGLIVDFRTRDLLRTNEDTSTVPLIYSQHIRDGRVRFPSGNGTEFIVADKKSHLQENKNYLFLKRFTSKEEHRRLQCGIYLRRYLPNFKFISTQNKINFIDSIHEMSECVIYGLYVLFNSTIYDKYYRILNGSTQVNSTEMNSVPIPKINVIEAMGKELIRTKNLSEEYCDKILRNYIYG